MAELVDAVERQREEQADPPLEREESGAERRGACFIAVDRRRILDPPMGRDRPAWPYRVTARRLT